MFSDWTTLLPELHRMAAARGRQLSRTDRAEHEDVGQTAAIRLYLWMRGGVHFRTLPPQEGTPGRPLPTRTRT